MSIPRHLHRLTFLHIISSILFFGFIRTPALVKASDKIDVGSNITDGSTLVSEGGSFTLGFFSPSPGIPTKRYLGIWFAFSPDAVYWVANRDRPLNDTSGVLVMNTSGNLVLLDGSHNLVWSSALTIASSPSMGAQLLDTGNFVVQGQNNGTALWQAFDHPCNTLLPGMKMGKNLWNGAEWYLSSWSSPTDPAPGSYRYITEPTGGTLTPENVLWSGNNTKKYRTGPWNGERFGGVPEMASYASNFTYHLTISPSEVTYGYTAKPGAPYSQLRVSDAGVVQRLVWDRSNRQWTSFLKEPRDDCDEYGKCGPFGLCDSNAASTSLCSCFRGFVPAFPDEWSMRDYSGGCRRNVSLDCGNESRSSTDGFQVVNTVKLPDTQIASVDMGLSLDECRVKCLANCSCVAYAAADIRGGGGGSGCITWTNSFVDLRYIDQGQDFYLRLPSSELVGGKKKKFPVVIVSSVVAAIIVVVLIILMGLYCRRRWWPQSESMPADDPSGSSSTPASASHSIDYEVIKNATENFSEDKKIGQGFFGTVYQCDLPEGESTRLALPVGAKVAVKVLKQLDLANFDRELQVMFTLCHVNLVRLLASCCQVILDNQGKEMQERILVYEYMERGSLDKYIFGNMQDRGKLNWRKRLEIISSIADGVNYLHLGSGKKILHRDLKPANILLHHDWTTKIADFGLAKQFDPNPADQQHTPIFPFGYAAPECWKGNITFKSDIYSFGVVLLEIISGKVNGQMQSLLPRVWEFWDERCPEKLLGVLDPDVPPSQGEADAELLSRLQRCIHIGLLCVQDIPEKRPDISYVVDKLRGHHLVLDLPLKAILHHRYDGETSGTSHANDHNEQHQPS
ncbi:unnamed protein product [Urochloa decumbens]|uniref:Receptor-like serine/threonine-protein kinase n=1 Tax=Urochloa decumbens TaxID=240449 RepID=A0ABC9GI72_9POAL